MMIELKYHEERQNEYDYEKIHIWNRTENKDVDVGEVQTLFKEFIKSEPVQKKSKEDVDEEYDWVLGEFITFMVRKGYRVEHYDEFKHPTLDFERELKETQEA